MQRRKFITLLGGAAVAWPIAASAQQPEQIKRIGVLTSFTESDLEAQSRLAALQQGLKELGWSSGRDVRIDYRWAGGDVDRIRAYAMELVALKPQVIVAGASTAAVAVRRATRSIPIVFVNVVDPIGAGFVKTLAHPAGNMTGFTSFEYGMSGKWLELLKEIAPDVRRVLVILDPLTPTGPGQFGALQTASPSLGIQLSPAAIYDQEDIERAIDSFATQPGGGIVVLPSAVSAAHRDIISLVIARHRLPAVYPYRYFATSGGLIVYGVDTVEPYRHGVPSYIDRILRGEKPADLPVQAPTKYELIINLKTAKALGLTVPPTLLARADEVIE
jgi:putative ABC transport system substrate-binding protein